MSTTQQFNGWATFNPEDTFAGTSLKKRAEKRTVQQSSEDKWIVHGDPKLNDAYPDYFIEFMKGEHRYTCSCYSHGQGEYRRRRMCSHVLAVILFRKKTKQEPGETGGSKPAATRIRRATYHDTEPKEPEHADANRAARGEAARRRDGKGSDRFKSVAADTYPDDPLPMDDDALGSPPLPDKFVKYRDNQWEAIVEIMEHLEGGKKVVMLSAPTGCLAGSTMIGVHRAGKGFQISIKDLLFKFDGSGSFAGKHWDQSIPTKIQRACDGVMRLATIKKVWMSGVKKTYRLTTEGGRQVEATATHPFLLERMRANHEDWCQLQDLKIGDRICVLDGQGKKTKKKRPWYRLVNGLHHHPFAARRGVNPNKGGYSVVQHRLVVEADMNGISYDDWVEMHRSGEMDADDNWTYLNPKLSAVHHIDHNPLNNELSNLQVLTHKEHAQDHGQDNAKNFAYQIGLDVVKSIEYVGMQQTYDIEVEDSPHNFIANKFVVHNSGKTIIAETVRRLMAGSTVYCCTTKSLQDQIQREFEYARIIKGRSNYPTQNRKDLNLTAEDCTGTSRNGYECGWCDSRSTCPYRMAKEDAVYSSLPILNIAYFLAETTHRDASQFRGRELVIIDEADTLEEQLMSSIEVIIGSRLRQSIGVKSLPKKTVTNDWVHWLEDEIVPAIRRYRDRLRQQLATLFGEDIEQKRQIGRLDIVLERIVPLIKPDGDGTRRIDEGWVMTGYEGDVKDPTIKFKPIRVNLHAREVLWERGKQFLLMSATLISPAQMAEDLGLEDNEWAVVNLDSTFPIERRPVFAPSVAPMTNEAKEKSWPLMAEAIEALLDENPGVRILVHTVSYRLTQYLYDNIKSARTLIYQGAWEREKKLGDFLDCDDAVLLAPSFGRGIDLPGEDCQVIVIAKVPYPYLGDKQISARLYGKGGRIWYSVQTIRAITQMTGRGMRSVDDWCDVYILDTSFKRLYREHKKLFPKWWRESLVLSMTDPKNRKLIEAAKERRESR